MGNIIKKGKNISISADIDKKKDVRYVYIDKIRNLEFPYIYTQIEKASNVSRMLEDDFGLLLEAVENNRSEYLKSFADMVLDDIQELIDSLQGSIDACNSGKDKFIKYVDNYLNAGSLPPPEVDMMEEKEKSSDALPHAAGQYPFEYIKSTSGTPYVFKEISSVTAESDLVSDIDKAVDDKLNEFSEKADTALSNTKEKTSDMKNEIEKKVEDTVNSLK
jgi:gas vesicle protein